MSIMNRFFIYLKPWRSLTKFLALSICCCVLVISCGSPSDQQAPEPSVSESGRVVFGTTLKPRTLDPADAYELAASNILYSLGDRLYTYKPGSSELMPQLATELPKVSADGLTYTIPIREGVVFHDGTPFNAEAMVFSLERFIENGGKPSSLLVDIVNSVEATGEYELTIQLKNPFAAFPSLLAFSGMCAVSPNAYEIGSGKFVPTKFVGTGPYKLADFKPSSIRLDIFEDYWGEKPLNQGLDFQIITSSANLYNSITTGAVDIAYQSLEADQIKSLQEEAEAGNWQVISAPSNNISYMVLNTQLAPFNKVEARQAVAALIDRKLINERVLRNQAEPAYSLIPTSFDVSQPAFKTLYGDGNIAQATALLAQAGFTAENPLQFEIWYPSGSATRQQVASLLKEYAAQTLGGVVQIQIQTVESANFFSNLSQGLYQSALVDWYPDFPDPDNFIHPLVSCSIGYEDMGCRDGASKSQGSFYYSDRMNKLIEQQRTTQNPAARQQIFAQIQELLARDVPVIPLWQPKEYAFAQEDLKDVQLDPIMQVILREIEKEDT
ncbi:MAG: ABC transporter substrate-binding protein [Coleofasciculaceae cyanobacterium]